MNPNVLWVDFNKLNFMDGAPVKKLKMSENEVYAGETSSSFVDAAPFVFEGL